MRIAARLHPFCHLPGTACLVPWTAWQVEAYPTLLRLTHLGTGEKREVSLPWRGPVLDFTVVLDLEKAQVHIFGHTEAGYRSCFVEKAGEGVEVVFKKRRASSMQRSVERLSLGSHTKLDWELVRRRRDLQEIVPVWHRLGQMTPEMGSADGGTASLLHECSKMEFAAQYEKLFMAGFHGMLAPRLEDDEHQGIVTGKGRGSPLALLTEGARHIRNLFFREEKGEVSLLPSLPPQFHAGRFIGIVSQEGDSFDLEWSKKTLRQVVIRPARMHRLSLRLQKPLSSFRVRHSMREKGKRHSGFVDLEKTAFLDRFE